MSDNADWTLGLGMHLFRQAERETLLSPFGFGWWPRYVRGSNTVKSRVGVASAERGELHSGRDRRRSTAEWELPLASPRRSALRRRLLLKERRKSSPLSQNQQRSPTTRVQSPVRARFAFSKVRLPGDLEFSGWARPKKFKDMLDLLKRPYPSSGCIPVIGPSLARRRNHSTGAYNAHEFYHGYHYGDPWLISKRALSAGAYETLEGMCSRAVAEIIYTHSYQFQTTLIDGRDPEWTAYWDLESTYAVELFRAYAWGYFENRVKDPRNWEKFRREGSSRKERRRFWWWHKVCKLHSHLAAESRGYKGKKKLVYLMQKWPSGRLPPAVSIAPAVSVYSRFVNPTVTWYQPLGINSLGLWERRARAHTPIILKRRSSLV